jgi:hypothetical protein
MHLPMFFIPGQRNAAANSGLKYVTYVKLQGDRCVPVGSGYLMRPLTVPQNQEPETIDLSSDSEPDISEEDNGKKISQVAINEPNVSKEDNNKKSSQQSAGEPHVFKEDNLKKSSQQSTSEPHVFKKDNLKKSLQQSVREPHVFKDDNHTKSSQQSAGEPHVFKQENSQKSQQSDGAKLMEKNNNPCKNATDDEFESPRFKPAIDRCVANLSNSRKKVSTPCSQSGSSSAERRESENKKHNRKLRPFDSSSDISIKSARKRQKVSSNADEPNMSASSVGRSPSSAKKKKLRQRFEERRKRVFQDTSNSSSDDEAGPGSRTCSPILRYAKIKRTVSPRSVDKLNSPKYNLVESSVKLEGSKARKKLDLTRRESSSSTCISASKNDVNISSASTQPPSGYEKNSSSVSTQRPENNDSSSSDIIPAFDKNAAAPRSLTVQPPEKLIERDKRNISSVRAMLHDLKNYQKSFLEIVKNDSITAKSPQIEKETVIPSKQDTVDCENNERNTSDSDLDIPLVRLLNKSLASVHCKDQVAEVSSTTKAALGNDKYKSGFWAGLSEETGSKEKKEPDKKVSRGKKLEFDKLKTILQKVAEERNSGSSAQEDGVTVKNSKNSQGVKALSDSTYDSPMSKPIQPEPAQGLKALSERPYDEVESMLDDCESSLDEEYRFGEIPSRTGQNAKELVDWSADFDLDLSSILSPKENEPKEKEKSASLSVLKEEIQTQHEVVVPLVQVKNEHLSLVFSGKKEIGIADLTETDIMKLEPVDIGPVLIKTEPGLVVKKEEPDTAGEGWVYSQEDGIITIYDSDDDYMKEMSQCSMTVDSSDSDVLCNDTIEEVVMKEEISKQSLAEVWAQLESILPPDAGPVEIEGLSAVEVGGEARKAWVDEDGDIGRDRGTVDVDDDNTTDMTDDNREMDDGSDGFGNGWIEERNESEEEIGFMSQGFCVNRSFRETDDESEEMEDDVLKEFGKVEETVDMERKSSELEDEMDKKKGSGDGSSDEIFSMSMAEVKEAMKVAQKSDSDVSAVTSSGHDDVSADDLPSLVHKSRSERISIELIDSPSVSDIDQADVDKLFTENKFHVDKIADDHWLISSESDTSASDFLTCGSPVSTTEASKKQGEFEIGTKITLKKISKKEFKVTSEQRSKPLEDSNHERHKKSREKSSEKLPKDSDKKKESLGKKRHSYDSSKPRDKSVTKTKKSSNSVSENHPLSSDDLSVGKSSSERKKMSKSSSKVDESKAIAASSAKSKHLGHKSSKESRSRQSSGDSVKSVASMSPDASVSDCTGFNMSVDSISAGTGFNVPLDSRRSSAESVHSLVIDLEGVDLDGATDLDLDRMLQHSDRDDVAMDARASADAEMPPAGHSSHQPSHSASQEKLEAVKEKVMSHYNPKTTLLTLPHEDKRLESRHKRREEERAREERKKERREKKLQKAKEGSMKQAQGNEQDR